MARSLRTDIGGQIYHVLNRGTAKMQIFYDNNDYELFEKILEQAIEKYGTQLLAYCIMPNHWHLLLKTNNDGELAQFMGWVANTHTRKWHSMKETTGQGHLYQGRYKSFICQDNEYFITLARYIERNALKANLVKKAEAWKWSSIWRRTHKNSKKRKILSEWPIDIPKNYISFLNTPQTEEEQNSIENSIKRNSPFGETDWTQTIIKKFKLQSTIKPIGRPKKGG